MSKLSKLNILSKFSSLTISKKNTSHNKPKNTPHNDDDEDEAIEKIRSLMNKDESDMELNHIYFYRAVTTDSCLDLNKKINEMTKKLLKHAIDYDIDPPNIYLHINSNGGSLLDAFSTVDTIKNSQIPIISIVEGAVASAATLISVVCSYRYATSSSVMLIHQLSNGFHGKYEEIKDDFENEMTMMNYIYDLYNKHSKLPLEFIKDILKHDIWLSSSKCLEYGLIDDIWTGPRVSIVKNSIDITKNTSNQDKINLTTFKRSFDSSSSSSSSSSSDSNNKNKKKQKKVD
jgi:ATP-dependent protease ClpP protease subunit